MTDTVQKKIAVITGASSGMGREFVLQLSQFVHVDAIWAVARREEALESLKSQVSVPVRPIALDLLKEDSFSRLEAILAEDGCIRYEYFLSEKDPDIILLIEQWQTKQHQQIHLSQPHMEKMRTFKADYIAETVLGEVMIS